MFARTVAIAAAVALALRKYPAAISGLTSVAIVLLARFGLHVTEDQLVAIIVPVASALAAAVHASVTPTVTLTAGPPSGERTPSRPDGGAP